MADLIPVRQRLLSMGTDIENDRAGLRGVSDADECRHVSVLRLVWENGFLNRYLDPRLPAITFRSKANVLDDTSGPSRGGCKNRRSRNHCSWKTRTEVIANPSFQLMLNEDPP